METKYRIGDHTLNIIRDNDAQSPRSWDNLSRMIFLGKHSHLGDKHNFNQHEYYYESRQDFMENGAKHVISYLRKEEKLDVVYITPVHMYTHSGSTISTEYGGQYADRFDSGTVGFAVLTREDIRENFMTKRCTKKLIERGIEILEAEVETLDKYIRGEVYGFELLDENDEELHSCWGFYGDDFKTNGILDDVKAYIDVNEEEIEELETTY